MHQLQVEHDCEERDVESVHFVGKIRERQTDIHIERMGSYDHVFVHVCSLIDWLLYVTMPLYCTVFSLNTEVSVVEIDFMSTSVNNY